MKKTNEDFIFLTGKIVKINPLKIKKRVKEGSTVITPQGIGIVRKQYPDLHVFNPANRLQVELIHHFGRTKSFYANQTKQFAIYHEPAQQLILLSPSCYKYIGESDQIVQYRQTTKGYAMLSDICKKEFEIFETFNSTKGGSQILRNIQLKGYIVKKKNNLLREIYNLTNAKISKRINHILATQSREEYAERLKKLYCKGLDILKIKL